jgi:hypothetical protein
VEIGHSRGLSPRPFRARAVTNAGLRFAGATSSTNLIPSFLTALMIVSTSGLCSPDSSLTTRGCGTPSFSARALRLSLWLARYRSSERIGSEWWSAGAPGRAGMKHNA